MNAPEETITELRVAVSRVRQALRLHAAEFNVRRSVPEVNSGFEVPGMTEPMVSLAGWAEGRQDECATVWYLRVDRTADFGWEIRRTIEIYPEDEVVRTLSVVECSDTNELSRVLPGLVDELLRLDAGPGTIGAG
jgi:hypothetical protein